MCLLLYKLIFQRVTKRWQGEGWRQFKSIWGLSQYFDYPHAFIYSRTIPQKKGETERALQFTIIFEGVVIIYRQLSDSDIQLTTTCLWPVIRACLYDGPLLT